MKEYNEKKYQYKIKPDKERILNNKIRKYKYRIFLMDNSNNLEIIYFPLIISYFIMNYFFFLSHEKIIRKLYSYNEVIITIKGTGNQNILSQSNNCGDSAGFNSIPDQILINGVLQNYTGKMVYNLENEFNNITLRWNSSLKDCNVMFSQISNIISFDFSKFDTSQVTDMRCMFDGLKNLEFLDLNDFITTSVVKMKGMFEGCISLKKLYINNFDTSSVTIMRNMFNNCKSLTSINISNFNISKVNNMNCMFRNCESLISLNLYNFNTLDISEHSQIFSGVGNGLIFCINEEKVSNIISQLSSFTKNCSYFCSSNSQYKYIIEKDEFIDKCENDNIYKYEYNNLCYKTCPEKTKVIIENTFLCQFLECKNYYNYAKTGCIDSIPKGYFLNSTNEKTIDKCQIKCEICTLESTKINLCLACNLEMNYYPKINDAQNENYFINCYNIIPEGYILHNNSIKPCYYTCRNCSEIGDENDNKCISCNLNYEFKNDSGNDKNCYEKCLYYYYFDSSNKHHCTSDNKCPDEYKLLKEKNECIKNCSFSNYIFEYNNTCYEICPNRTHISDNNICEDDLICEKYYNYNYTGCLEVIPEGYYLNNSKLKTIDKCNIKCKSCNLESMKNNLCLSCNINKNYYPKMDDNLNNNNFINCYNEIPDGYILESNIYKPCYPTCKYCKEIGNKDNNKCIQCKMDYTFISDFENDNNCYEICKYYYYFDSNKKYYCTIDKNCPIEFNKLIKEKNKCIDKCDNDNKYKYEYNNLCYELCPKGAKISQNNNFLCEKECPNDTPYENLENNECIKECKATELFTGLCKINNDSPEIKDNMMENIKEELMNGGLDFLLDNMTKGEKVDLVMKDDKAIYQFTTTENQNDNEQNSNISIINLGECEYKLKDYYNIDEKEPLLIYKIDIYEEGILSPKVEYEIYNSKTKEQLNLTVCNDIKINILIPALINKEEEYKYNSSSEYYNDICYTFTTENGTDIILDDRKNEYIKNNMSLCESNCQFDEYNSDTQKAKCECEVKIKLPLMSEIVINKDKLYNNFVDVKKNINVKVMKCYKILFTKNGLKYNIGSYILLSIIILTIVFCIIFFVKGFKFFNDEINKIFSYRQKKEEKYIKCENINQEINNEKNGRETINNIK